MKCFGDVLNRLTDENKEKDPAGPTRSTVKCVKTHPLFQGNRINLIGITVPFKNSPLNHLKNNTTKPILCKYQSSKKYDKFFIYICVNRRI